METREQELSFGTKINGIFCFIVGDISFSSFDRSYISPTVQTKTGHVFSQPCINGMKNEMEEEVEKEIKITSTVKIHSQPVMR